MYIHAQKIVKQTNSKLFLPFEHHTMDVRSSMLIQKLKPSRHGVKEVGAGHYPRIAVQLMQRQHFAHCLVRHGLSLSFLEAVS
jgi:hypothetical protein